MPCDSSGYEPHDPALARVACLLDELDGRPFTHHSWDGYHPRVYGKAPTRAERDALVAELCSRLQSVDVSRYSLEMQIWWRDHQEADRQRVAAQVAAAKAEKAREKALAKLTPHERRLLGLKE